MQPSTPTEIRLQIRFKCYRVVISTQFLFRENIQNDDILDKSCDNSNKSNIISHSALRLNKF